MSKYIILFLLLITGVSGCKMKKEVATHDTRHGKAVLKSTRRPSDRSTVSGHVKDLKSGEYIAFAKVTLVKDGMAPAAAQTDSEGYFELKNISEGKYLLRIANSGYEVLEVPFEIKEASSISIEADIVVFVQQVEKPVIYLYPTEKQDISVHLTYKGELTHAYPAYPETGWKVTAEPNGTLWDEKGQEYYALFWEGQPTTPLLPQNGFIIAGNNTAAFLEEKLAFLGLNRREANEFMMYWLPRMENNPYNLIHFAGEEYEKQSVLKILPQPETTIRVMMLTQALECNIDFPLQDIRNLKKERKGFTAVEWGGSVIRNAKSDL